MIGVLNYGIGNVGSIVNMLDHLYLDCRVIVAPDDLARHECDRYILPGVGAFDRGMQELASRGFIEFLDREVRLGGKLLLGICLGMQLLTLSSEEGLVPGLGWVPASTVRLRPRLSEKVPNMGWRDVAVCRPNRLLPPDEASRFYFVHSYGVVCHEEQDVVARLDYAQGVCACLERGNIFGVQFHPEKSHRFGLDLLHRFGTLQA